MNVWEIVIMMVVGTLCITTGIGFVYSSIVATVERYQIRKTKRELEIYAQVIKVIPDLFKELTKIVYEFDEKDKKDTEEFMKSFDEKLKEINK